MSGDITAISTLVSYQLQKSVETNKNDMGTSIDNEEIPLKLLITNNSTQLQSLPTDSVNAVQVEDAPHDRKACYCCSKKRVTNCCRIFTTFLISRVGLFIIMCCYVMMGGIMFRQLEEENEHLSILRGEENSNRLVQTIYEQVLQNSADLNDQKFGDFLTNEIEKFRDFVTNSTRNGTLISSDTNQWDLFGAVFYAVTLVTTIGYGHITCKTRNGQLVTIFYSAIGIPLTALFVVNVGSTMANVFKYTCSKFDTCRQKYKTKRYTQQLFVKSKIHCDDDVRLAPKHEQPIDYVDNMRPTIVRDEQTDVFDSRLYAMYLKNSKMLLDNVDPGNQENISKSVAMPEDQLNSRIGVAISRIDNLIANNAAAVDMETHVEKNLPLSELNDKRYLKSVNFQGMNSGHYVTTDGSVEKSINLFENPFELMDQTKSVQNKWKFLQKFKDHLTRAGRRSLKSKPIRLVDENLRRSSSESKLLTTDIHDTKFELKHSKRRRSSSLKSRDATKLIADQASGQTPISSSSNNASTSSHKNSPSLSQKAIVAIDSPRSMTPFDKASLAPNMFNNQSSFKRTELNLLYSDTRHQQKDTQSLGLLFYITIMILPVYLIIGMFIFSSFENWTKLDAFYFCFITLTTIGFGDFIPGSSISPHSSKLIMTISALYILVGLILISMCAHLIKDQLKFKVKVFTRKFGFSH